MSIIKRMLLAFICIPIISGALYWVTYVYKVKAESVQNIKIEDVNINNISKFVEVKVVEGKIVMVEKKSTPEVKAENKEEVKIQVNKKAIKKRSDMIIVIDPGHASGTSPEKEQQAPGSSIMKIKEPGGAQGIKTRTPEYVVNMAVAVRLKGLLKEKGYTVIMTKTENKQMLGNIARAQVGNKVKADLVIRIHADSNKDSSVHGASMLIPSNSKSTKAIYKTSKRYGQIVHSSFINSIGMSNRGIVERNDLTGFNWSVVPVILVEMGFQSNVEEDKKLASENYQIKLAKALSVGIDKALFN